MRGGDVNLACVGEEGVNPPWDLLRVAVLGVADTAVIAALRPLCLAMSAWDKGQFLFMASGPTAFGGYDPKVGHFGVSPWESRRVGSWGISPAGRADVIIILKPFINGTIKLLLNFCFVQGFYLPWALLALDLIFGNRLKPNILGMLVGHLYYFLTVLHPLAGGKFKFKTPLWIHKIVAYWGEGTQINAPVQSNPSDGIVFRGRSHRLGGTQITTRSTAEQTNRNGSSPQQQNQGDGIAFRGRSYRLNG
ncbi:derlin-1-like [Gastrolobium bilobum]|uniref:derlin-1-like n=1 Tax=Gastrolobium bilobum TaxID=150636 RepID=UPI002AB149DE|nr:derlin-1-like [Gastrolobium bilobum]